MNKSNKVIINELSSFGDIFKTKTVGEFLLTLRKNLELTGREFGDKIKLSKSMIGSLENNQQELKQKYINKIVKSMKLSDPEHIHLLKLVNKQSKRGF